MVDLHGNEPVKFDNGTADALSTALNGAAESIEGQAGSRQSYVNTASQDFRGHFSEALRAERRYREERRRGHRHESPHRRWLGRRDEGGRRARERPSQDRPRLVRRER
ncbi:hypothetical protein [Curtobacterium flaccumfaciens]|uniref:hypothetical protein n=1 Tax=Curtobacterium flaccumfaciens TaxID=2035 RepID=UPI0021C8DF5C|nr:hypothetical protein N8D75_00615 [Curtobacterium flaccumfaciens]